MSRQSSKERARVLIVDDHPAVREALAMRISRQPDLEICGEAADVSDALRLVAETQPDVAVIDISLKTGCGVDLIKRIKGRNDTVRMLVWSTHSESLYAERATPRRRLRVYQQGPGHRQDRRGDPAGARRQGLLERRDDPDDAAPRRRPRDTGSQPDRRSTRWPTANWRSSVCSARA